MFFQALGTFVARRSYLVIASWVILATTLMLVAPSLDAVSSTDQKDFLPQNAPFTHASEVIRQHFPDTSAASTAMILVDAGAGHSVDEPGPQRFIAALEAWLKSADAPDNISQVAGPASAPELAATLVSPNRRIALIAVGLTTIMDAKPTADAVHAVDAWLKQHTPPGIAAYQSGDAALNAQTEEATFTTMDRTIWITVALVVLALLAIYRSPVSPLIPLFAVTMALLVTLGITALLAQAGVIAVLTQITALLVVVIYGAGTDYCLFLISRFREELADEPDARRAVGRTVRLVGETITGSAGTIFVGFMALVFAEMGVFKSAGPMLAIGIVISLLAGLTLVPALLAVLGKRAFWPGRASHRASGGLYAFTSKAASSRPVLIIVLIVVVMTPFSLRGLARPLTYDMVSELPAELPAVKGYRLLAEQMGSGVLFPLTVVVTGQNETTMAQAIARLSAELRALDGVADVRGLHSPLGYGETRLSELLRIDRQLALLLADEGGQALQADPEATIAAMRDYLELLAQRFPALAATSQLQVAQEILAGGPAARAPRQQELRDAIAGLAERARGLEQPYLLPPSDDGALFAALRPLHDQYIAQDGRAFKLEVVLADPVGEGGFAAVKAIRELLGRQQGGEAVVGGFTALYADMRDTMSSDLYRATGFILIGIFLVLLLMLRSVVAPLYLIATVLLSFTCTLGLTSIFFELAYGVEQLSWLLPVFMFVFLVALGIDYSVFLFGRIKEEVAYHGVREGVHVAVAATGAIITSAGLILAGTFAGMLAGEIQFLRQLGFAVAVGVLIDTFVVRTILDPALATLFGRWTWWPGGVPRPPRAADEHAAHEQERRQQIAS